MPWPGRAALNSWNRLIAIYAEVDERTSTSRENSGDRVLRDALCDAVFSFRRPANVAEVSKILKDSRQDNDSNLAIALIVRLIERDAAEKYDSIDGYLGCVEMDEEIVHGIMTRKDASALDGWGLCVWIDENYPPEE